MKNTQLIKAENMEQLNDCSEKELKALRKDVSKEYEKVMRENDAMLEAGVIITRTLSQVEKIKTYDEFSDEQLIELRSKLTDEYTLEKICNIENRYRKELSLIDYEIQKRNNIYNMYTEEGQPLEETIKHDFDVMTKDRIKIQVSIEVYEMDTSYVITMENVKKVDKIIDTVKKILNIINKKDDIELYISMCSKNNSFNRKFTKQGE